MAMVLALFTLVLLLPPMPMLLPMPLAMELPMPLTPLALLESPPLPSPEWLEVMPVLADMSPTLLESSTLPRGPLMPSPRLRLMPTTLEDMVLATAMVDSMVDTDTGPMVPIPTPMDTTERGPLRPSLRLMLTPPLTDMVSPMLDTAMPVLP